VREITEEIARVREELTVLEAQLRAQNGKFEPELTNARAQNAELVAREAELEWERPS
jgi:hypothetical protein